MNSEEMKALQARLDKEFPDGLLVWESFPEFQYVDTYLIPRLFVVNKDLLLISEMNDNTIYTFADPKTVEFGDEYVSATFGNRLYRFYKPTDRAKEVLKGLVKDTHTDEVLGRIAQW